MTIRRILCVGEHSEPSNAYRRVLAFRRLGYEVTTYDRSLKGLPKYGLLRRLLERVGKPVLNGLHDRGIVRVALKTKPDLIFCEKSVWLRRDTINELKQTGAILCHYNPDDPFGEYTSGWGSFVECIPLYDVHFVPKQKNIEDYQSRGARHVFTFDRSFDPVIHRKRELSEADRHEYECAVGFIGTWASFREMAIAHLIRNGITVSVRGGGWWNGPHWKLIKPYWKSSTLGYDEYATCISGMKIALHFLRRENRDLQDSRTFEIPACGRFMLAEDSIDHRRLFNDLEEVVFFQNEHDLLEKVRYYLEHSEERERIAVNGHIRAMNSPYSHDHRVQELIDIIEKVYP